MSTPEQVANFVDDSGNVREAGRLVYPQATPSDVLTVQDDGTIEAAAGGGSSPGVGDWIAVDTNNTETIANGYATQPPPITFDDGSFDHNGTSITLAEDQQSVVCQYAGLYSIVLACQYTADDMTGQRGASLQLYDSEGGSQSPVGNDLQSFGPFNQAHYGSGDCSFVLAATVPMPAGGKIVGCGLCYGAADDVTLDYAAMFVSRVA